MPMTVGERVLCYRLHRGLGPTELAELAGVSRSALYLCEMDKGKPRAKTLARLATALGVTMGELLGLDHAARFATPVDALSYLRSIGGKS